MRKVLLMCFIFSSFNLYSIWPFDGEAKPGPGGLFFSNHPYTPREVGDRFLVAYGTLTPAFYALCRIKGPALPAAAALTGIIASHLIVRAKNKFINRYD